MTAPTPVDRVAQLLLGASYRQLAMPLEVGGLKFAFPAAFLGMDRSPDLVLVLDTALQEEQRILQQVESLARALDVVGSKRPLTTVLAGPRPTGSVLDSMSRVCRVLPIGRTLDEDPEAALKNWLAVLMPLELPAPSGMVDDPLAEIARRIEELPVEFQELVLLSSQGAEAVQSRMLDIVSEALGSDEEDQSNDG